METIGDRITKSRIKAGLNQKELCERTGLKESTLSRYENSIREPRASTLILIGKELNVSVDYLIGTTTEIKPYNLSYNQYTTVKDLEKILENTEKLISQEGLTFHGNPVSKEDINKLLTAIKVGISVMDLNT